MSRAGKPTDNPVNEALNGWIKEELFIDFRLEECRTRDAVKDVLRRYVDFYNRQRPCFAIGYDTPDNYCKRFYRGELEQRDTFSQRILSEEPKFVQKRRTAEKWLCVVSTFCFALWNGQTWHHLQIQAFQGMGTLCLLSKTKFGKKYCQCLFLKKQPPQKITFMSTFEKQIKK